MEFHYYWLYICIDITYYFQNNEKFMIETFKFNVDIYVVLNQTVISDILTGIFVVINLTFY